MGGIGLRLRAAALGGLEPVFRLGMAAGALGVIPLGGFVPVLSAWLDDRLESWADVVTRLGGVWPGASTLDPDADHGPVIARSDAPELFEEVAAAARKIGVRPPGQIRLTYLPCCAATAWGRNDRALMIGLPLFSVLSRAELRAVIAHELAHLARGDATRTARAARFLTSLGQALEDRPGAAWNPLRAWARLCHAFGSWLIAPIARGQEARADRFSAGIAGGGAAASALVKVALVQPIFRELIEHYDPAAPNGPNLYAAFRACWQRLPEPLLMAMRHRVLAAPATAPDAAHPALIERLAVVQAYPSRNGRPEDAEPAVRLLGDPVALERMLHNRLFGLTEPVAPSVFHRTGSST